MTTLTPPLDIELFEDRLRHIEGPLRTVVDIGACLGALTIPALRANATVVAVEPCLWYMTRLLVAAHNIVTGVFVPVTAAVWMEGGRLCPLYRRTVGDAWGDPGQVGLVPCFDHYRAFGIAPTVTLTELIRQIQVPEIDLLKMDVEGAEHFILPATPREVLRQARYLDLDNHNIGPASVDLPSLLNKYGFTLETTGLWRRTTEASDVTS